MQFLRRTAATTATMPTQTGRPIVVMPDWDGTARYNECEKGRITLIARDLGQDIFSADT